MTLATILTGATVVHGTVVGEHPSEWAPAGLHPPLLVLLEAVLGVLVLAGSRSVTLPATVSGVGSVVTRAGSRTAWGSIDPADLGFPTEVGVPGVSGGVSELVAVGVCAMSPVRPGRARHKTVPRGRARLVPTFSARAR